MIKPGSKIKINCVVDKCPVYAVALGLNNLSGDDYNFVCPDEFCTRIREYSIVTCGTCKQERNVLLCSFIDGDFKCAFCEEGVVEKKEEIEKQTEEPKQEEPKKEEPLNKDIKITKEAKIKLEAVFNKLQQTTGGYLTMKDFFFEQGDSFNFCNPQAIDPSRGILKVKSKEWAAMDEDAMIGNLKNFYSDVLAKYESKSCAGCDFQPFFPGHLNCLECVRNKESNAMEKKDNFNGQA